MVDVTHDRNDRRARLEILRRLDLLFLRASSGVLLFSYRLKSELTSDQFDLVEIETLVDGDHQAEVLESESNDLRCRHFENAGQLADRDEFVDVTGFLFALDCCDALRLHLLAVARV